jgi:hypothetical protein
MWRAQEKSSCAGKPGPDLERPQPRRAGRAEGIGLCSTDPEGDRTSPPCLDLGFGDVNGRRTMQP